jgi:hypothetical protein
MIFGLAEGWWYFEDHDLRPGSPLLSIQKWTEVLARLGFRNVDAYPRDQGERTRTEFGLIVAQNTSLSPDQTRSSAGTNGGQADAHLSDQIRRIMNLEKLGAETLVYVTTPGGTQLVARQNTARNLPHVGDSVGLQIDAAAAHLFDSHGRVVAPAVR